MLYYYCLTSFYIIIHVAITVKEECCKRSYQVAIINGANDF